MLRTSKVHYKSSELYPILHEHFGKSMNLARIKALSMMVCALCKVQRVTHTKLAAAFDSEAAAGSSLRRIQRLIAECEIRTDLIAKLILKLIPVQGPTTLHWTGPTGSSATQTSTSLLWASSTTVWRSLSCSR